ncbi:MAG: membrane-associated protease 1 [Clostridiales bacterium]|nr:membrane-associated protease 1 [Clostridiales bacterium]
MGVRVDIDGIQLTEKEIESFRFISEVPEDSNARTSSLSATVEIKGKILTVLGGAESTIQIEEWSRVAATDANCYRNITIKTVSQGQVVRQYVLTKAFVVDYIEDFDIEQGIGHFTLIARQKKDNLTDLAITGGFGA